MFKFGLVFFVKYKPNPDLAEEISHDRHYLRIA
jgi:hypothetical protein